MESSAVALTKLTVFSFVDALSDEDAFVHLAKALDDDALLAFMATAGVLRLRLLAEEIWLDKVTSLTLLYSGLAHLEQGADESPFAWYARCRRGVASGERMALAHARGEMPYLRMYGSFVDGIFTPSTPLRFPAPYGLIAEVVAYAARLGKLDAAMDGALMFASRPPNVDERFRAISRLVATAKSHGVAAPSNLRRLIEILEKVYTPSRAMVDSPATLAVSSSAMHELESAQQSHSEVRERVIRTLRLRLSRNQHELDRAVPVSCATMASGLSGFVAPAQS